MRLDFGVDGGSTFLVTPQNWLFQGGLMDSTVPLEVGVARLLGCRWSR